MRMTYQVFIQQAADHSYRATPLMFPDCTAIGKTRDEALANLRSALSVRLSQGEIVTLEIGEPEHPWMKGAGIFKDDPTFEDLLAEIEAYRREVDAAESDRADVSP
jgi:predicted RNase H-like HicB family nuclease